MTFSLKHRPDSAIPRRGTALALPLPAYRARALGGRSGRNPAGWGGERSEGNSRPRHGSAPGQHRDGRGGRGGERGAGRGGRPLQAGPQPPPGLGEGGAGSAAAGAGWARGARREVSGGEPRGEERGEGPAGGTARRQGVPAGCGVFFLLLRSVPLGSVAPGEPLQRGHPGADRGRLGVCVGIDG